MNDVKILSITCFSNKFNYGQRLQAYALQRFVKVNFGHSVYLLDPRNPQTLPDFGRFENDHMNICRYTKDIFDEFDLCMVGSDQVFNSVHPLSNYYFSDGMFKAKMKLVSYAGSANGFIAKGCPSGKIMNGLKAFARLSFREKCDADAAVRIFPGKKIECNIDPIFLLLREEWTRLAEKPPFIEKDEIFDFEYMIANKPNSIEKSKDGIKKISVFGSAAAS